MSLSKDDVIKIAKLSRIKLTGDEVDHYRQEITQILAWIEQLQEVDTDNVAEMTSVSQATLPERKDAVTDGNIVEDILKNAPQKEYDCFVVPKVVE